MARYKLSIGVRMNLARNDAHWDPGDVPSLTGHVALVTGASRGVGRGIAVALAERRAKVYFTARTAVQGEGSVPLPGSLAETAEAVAAHGGDPHPLLCDHRDDAQVEAVFRQISAEQGKLDVLVNNVWGGYQLLHEGGHELFYGPFWELPLHVWDDMFAAGVRAHLVATRLAVPLLQKGNPRLIVNISSFAALTSPENVALGVAKAATDRLTTLTAEQLREEGVAVVSLYPGLVRTEGVLKWRDYLDLSNSESPELVGRAVVALANDAAVLQRTGETLVVAELAEDYGFSEDDGSRPKSLRPMIEQT
jgi:dehydrogenase/reductase SDR family member 1